MNEAARDRRRAGTFFHSSPSKQGKKRKGRVVFMKKILACALALAIMLVMAAGAEQAPSFEAMGDIEWTFSSGAGGWYTCMRIGPDGAFTGDYHDSEMGDVGEGYPNGSVYGCLFHGQLTLGEQVNAYTWKVHVDAVELDEGQAPEAIEDEIRFVTVEPYGIKAGSDMLLYLPGAPVSELPEDFLIWAHIFDDSVKELPYYGLYDEAEATGFIGEIIPEEVQP